MPHLTRECSIQLQLLELLSLITRFSTKNYKELIANHQPDIENPPTRWLRDSTDYMMISGEFVAKGGEQYLLLRNFKSYEDTPITPEPVKDDLGDYWPLQLPYFLDDLSPVAWYLTT